MRAHRDGQDQFTAPTREMHFPRRKEMAHDEKLSGRDLFAVAVVLWRGTCGRIRFGLPDIRCRLPKAVDDSRPVGSRGLGAV